MKRLLIALTAGLFAVTAHAQVIQRSDVQLKEAIERHVWYSSRHGYRFLSNGKIAVDGYSADERWSIHNGLLYRDFGNSHFNEPTKIIEVNDSQLVEQEISGEYKGAVE